jgi:membrane-associated phospholipid phosphatase
MPLCGYVAMTLYIAFVAVFLILWGLLDLVLPKIWKATQFVANRFAASSMRYGVVKRVLHVASPFRDYLPVIVTMIVGALLAAWTGDEFLDLAELVHAKSPMLQQVDSRVHDWAVAQRFGSATTFFDVMSTVGGPIGVAVIGVVVVVALLLRKHLHRVAYLGFTAVGGGGLDWELKRYFARARPAIAQMLMHASGYSFPSGHAMGSTVVFGALAYLAFRALHRWRWKAASIALAATLIIGVALSRVYLGVHWISDVGAGITAGLLWVTMTTVAYETFRRIHLIRTIRGNSVPSPREAGRGARGEGPELPPDNG